METIVVPVTFSQELFTSDNVAFVWLSDVAQ